MVVGLVQRYHGLRYWPFLLRRSYFCDFSIPYARIACVTDSEILFLKAQWDFLS
jgi:hypothetical protein